MHRSVLLAVPVLCAVLTALLLWSLLKTGVAHRLALDTPNHRSLHDLPTPRIGGLVLLAVALVAAVVVGNLPAWLWAGALVLMAVGAIDDRRALPAGIRLVVQAAVAAWAAGQAGSAIGPLWLPALVVVVVWSMNAFNFMDGSDGMAGGMALFGFGACGLVAAGAGDTALAVLCLSVAGAAAGFLGFNFAPARVFMGDAGSVPLGFLAAAVGLVGATGGVWPTWFVPVVFSPFLVDATLTLFCRALAGQRVWEPHREHVYQRAVRGGLGHARTALVAYALMVAAALVAVLARVAAPAPQTALLSAWCLASILLFFTLRRRLPAR